MTMWVIAILLALILVALMASNKDAARSVKTVFIWSFAIFVALVLWASFLGALLWMNSVDAESGDWKTAIAFALGGLIPPILFWVSRQEFKDTYRKSTKAGVLFSLKYVGTWILVIGFLVGGKLLEIEKLLVPTLVGIAGLTGLILILRTVSGDPLREVWLGPKEPDSVWDKCESRRRELYEKDAEIWDKDQEKWDSKSTLEKEAIHAAAFQREKAIEDEIKAIEEKYNTQLEAWRNRPTLTFRYIFWMSLLILAFQFVGDAWNAAHSLAMEISFVKGRSWLAHGLVAGTIIALIWSIVWVMDTLHRRKEHERFH